MMAKNGVGKGVDDVRKRKRKGKEKSDGFHLGSIFSRRLQRLWLFPTSHCYYYHTMPIHRILIIYTYYYYYYYYTVFSSHLLIQF